MIKTYKIAHIREQGQDMIIFPLDRSFGNLSASNQNAELDNLERAAHNARLAGRAVCYWQQGSQTRFIGPPQWKPFLQCFTFQTVLSLVNKKLTVDFGQRANIA